ncbi:hypothetical protein NE237_019343 [Protea cynaroides]|uniref:Uncharacterized protein n=1 Tax=Protea cynaroides TaxID=273540 RepID=A0A9Q0KBQ3_9MAGN|nr:hypothetical protein NE237_019343 [Protea cynaroides]
MLLVVSNLWQAHGCDSLSVAKVVLPVDLPLRRPLFPTGHVLSDGYNFERTSKAILSKIWLRVLDLVVHLWRFLSIQVYNGCIKSESSRNVAAVFASKALDGCSRRKKYGKLSHDRTKKSMIKTRQIQVIDNDRGVLMRPLPGMVGMPNSKEEGSTCKTCRNEKNEKRSWGSGRHYFKLFESKPNWALKQLVKETDQPVGHVKRRMSRQSI